jgi:hypothetical protein
MFWFQDLIVFRQELIIPCTPLEVDGGSGQWRVDGGVWKMEVEDGVEGGG